MIVKYDELKALEEETGYVLPYSPTQRVGDVTITRVLLNIHIKLDFGV